MELKPNNLYNTNGTYKCNCRFYNSGLSESIQNMYVMHSQLILVFKSKVLAMSTTNVNKSAEVQLLLDCEEDLDCQGTIRRAKWHRDHQVLYFIFLTNKDGKKFICSLDVVTAEVKLAKIGKYVSNYEIDNLVKDKIWLIEDNLVYGVYLEEKHRQMFEVNYRDKQEEPEKEVLIKGKGKITCLKFDHQMKFYYIQEQKSIKKYRIDTKELISVFTGQNTELKQLIFSQGLDLMIR